MSYEDKQKAIEKRCSEKDRQIAFLNANNLAIQFMPEKLKGTEEGFKAVLKYRDMFYAEWLNWKQEQDDLSTNGQTKGY